MKLEITKDLKDNNYKVEINITEVTEDELELFSDFGSLSINIGGEFLDDDEAPLFSTGDAYKRIPSDEPITKIFTQAQYGDDAETIANAFAKEISDRIEAAVTELKSKSDGFSGTTEVIL